MSDCRSAASERFAFQCLGLSPSDVLCDEKRLIQTFAHMGVKVPEAIVLMDGKVVSIEVKRVAGNRLPSETKEDGSQYRRVVRSRTGVVWPWTKTIRNAFEKGNRFVVNAFSVTQHVVVIVYPDTLDKKNERRLIRHVERAVSDSTSHDRCCKVRVVTIAGGEELFDRIP